MPPTRQAQIDALRDALTGLPTALAAWEAGSAAFGVDDGMSDVDVAVVSADKDAVFAACETALEMLAPIALRYHVPEPAWHGFAQRFYLLEGASRFHMIDLSVQPPDSKDPFLDPARHGTPKVWFDRGAYTVPSTMDPAALEEKLRARVPVLAAWFALTQPIVEKEIARGRAVDAVSFYHGLTLRPLVELLRIVHAPARHDFGLRYLQKDLPPDVYAELEPLAFVADLADLAAKHARAGRWFERIRAGWEGTRPARI